MNRALKILTVLTIASPLSSCMTPQLQPPPLLLQDFADQKEFWLARDYVWRIGATNEVIVVPRGFVTDMTSIPPALRGFLNQFGRYGRAALVHDYLYWSQACTKEQADNLLMIGMKESGVGRVRRNAIYTGVSTFGRGAWNANRNDRLRNLPKVLDPAHEALADRMTWLAVRQVLVRDGVRDPAMPVSPAACALGNSRQVP